MFFYTRFVLGSMDCNGSWLNVLSRIVVYGFLSFAVILTVPLLVIADEAVFSQCGDNVSSPWLRELPPFRKILAEESCPRFYRLIKATFKVNGMSRKFTWKAEVANKIPPFATGIQQPRDNPNQNGIE